MIRQNHRSGPTWTSFCLVRTEPVNELKKTGSNQSFTVPVRFFDFLRIGKPVAVVVLPKKGKKLDWTRLLNTKQGHLSRDCPTKKRPTTNSTPPSYALTWAPASTNTQKKKMSGKELYTHIRSLTAHMDEEEKEKFLNEAEEEGF